MAKLEEDEESQGGGASKSPQPSNKEGGFDDSMVRALKESIIGDKAEFTGADGSRESSFQGDRLLLELVPFVKGLSEGEEFSTAI